MFLNLRDLHSLAVTKLLSTRPEDRTSSGVKSVGVSRSCTGLMVNIRGSISVLDLFGAAPR